MWEGLKLALDMEREHVGKVVDKVSEVLPGGWGGYRFV